MSEFIEQAKTRYDELLQQKAEVDKELKPLHEYLQNVGALAKRKGGRKKRVAKTE